MKSGHRYIIHILILLILVFGLGLLFWRNEVFDVLHDNSGLYDPSLLLTSSQITAKSKDSIDTSIFDNAKFIVLKNNVYKFDFDNICRNLSSQKQSEDADDKLSGQEYAASVVCFLGNRDLFSAPNPEKAPNSDKATTTEKVPARN